jgi:nitroreductase
MDLNEAIRKRKSIRGFKPYPVSRDIIADILKLAVRAPSGKNIQPWEFIVLTGEELRAVSEANAARLRRAAPPDPDIAIDLPRGKYQARNVEMAKLLYAAMDIPRRDRKKREWWWERGFRYFDAPAVIIIHVGSDVNIIDAIFGLGAVSQSICLAALARGLGTCIVNQGIAYPEAIRAHVAVPPDNLLVIAIAIGYPDHDFPANSVVSPRVPMEDITTWYGYD